MPPLRKDTIFAQNLELFIIKDRYTRNISFKSCSYHKVLHASLTGDDQKRRGQDNMEQVKVNV